MKTGTIITLACLLAYGDTARLSARFAQYQAKILQAAGHVMNDPDLRQQYAQRVQATQTAKQRATPLFQCTVETSPEVPSSVHQLRPADIKVVAALGDSITAGNGLGAENIVEVTVQHRGESWSIGAEKSLDDGVVTLPNILRRFNPELKGGAVCSSSYTDAKYAWMNLAVPGGTSSDMADQATAAIARMQEDERIDLPNDWKIFTMFIGANDLCESCHESSTLSHPDAYLSSVEAALDVLHAGSPRTFVNLQVMFDVVPVRNMSSNALCDFLHQQFCDCVMNETSYESVKANQMEYYNKLKELVDGGKYDDRDDFAVVLQPHLRDMDFPRDPLTGKYDLDYVSYDCFHPSRIAHQAFAYMLWQNMLTPVGKKPCTSDIGGDGNPIFTCPTPEHPYLFTNRNSNVTGYDPPAYPGPYC